MAGGGWCRGRRRTPRRDWTRLASGPPWWLSRGDPQGGCRARIRDIPGSGSASRAGTGRPRSGSQSAQPMETWSLPLSGLQVDHPENQENDDHDDDRADDADATGSSVHLDLPFSRQQDHSAAGVAPTADNPGRPRPSPKAWASLSPRHDSVITSRHRAPRHVAARRAGQWRTSGGSQGTPGMHRPDTGRASDPVRTPGSGQPGRRGSRAWAAHRRGAEGEIRTHMTFRPAEFKSAASAGSATSARCRPAILPPAATIRGAAVAPRRDRHPVALAPTARRARTSRTVTITSVSTVSGITTPAIASPNPSAVGCWVASRSRYAV